MLSILTITTTSYGMKFNNFIYSKMYKLLNFVEHLAHKEQKLEYLPPKDIKNEVLIKTNGLHMDFWNKALYSPELREKIIKDGTGFADIFLGYNQKEDN